MPARSAVSLLAGPAAPLVPAPLTISVRRQCLCHYTRHVGGGRDPRFAVDGYAPLWSHNTPSAVIAPPPSSLSSLLPAVGLRYHQSSIRRRRQGNNELAHDTARGGCRHWFHSTTARLDDAIDNARNHYEILKVPPGASAADIKKSFYQLSKTHHPDVHEAAARRAASRRFMRISEAYSILSSPTKRAKYDRDHHLGNHSTSSSSSSAHAQNRRSGSYSSTGPAGGRPASGLSRRRGTFQGPPPSFYRSGGWGAHDEKRRAAHDESTGGSGNIDGSKNPSSSSSSSPDTASSSTSPSGGMGPGQTPFRGEGYEYVPRHFDKEAHERTGRHVDQRREARQSGVGDQQSVNGGGGGGGQKRRRNGVWEDLSDLQPEKGAAGPFFAIAGVILLSFVGPFFISRLWRVDDAPAIMKTTKKSSVENRG